MLTIALCVVAYLVLSAYACGEYMSSTGRGRMHPLLYVLAIPGMCVLAVVFLEPATVFSWLPRKKKPRRR